MVEVVWFDYIIVAKNVENIFIPLKGLKFRARARLNVDRKKLEYFNPGLVDLY